MDNPTIDNFSTYGFLFIVAGVLATCLVIFFWYSIIRAAVARGLRDHQLWMERNRPANQQPVQARESVGQYFGFQQGPPPGAQ
jgi:hypothetical protein